MSGISSRPGLVEEYVETTGAVLGGRDGWDAAGDSRPYGGAWSGPIFVLTHHPEDATPAEGVTFLNCSPAEAVRIGLEAAGGKNLEVHSPTIGRQLLELGLIDEIDEIDLHIAPILLGQGIRLYDNPGGEPIRLHRVGEGDPTSAVNVRYRPITTVARPASLACLSAPATCCGPCFGLCRDPGVSGQRFVPRSARSPTRTPRAGCPGARCPGSSGWRRSAPGGRSRGGAPGRR
jgi:dihydrofolate reductase